MIQPKISVIVPIYKVEKYLVHCVNSIIEQTYRNLEIILVDDGSPDSCPFICDEFAQKDPRIIVIHKENGGLSDARNAGLDIASGEYILFVDSDDYISVNMCEILLNRLLKYDADMAICNYLRVSEKQELICEKNSILPIKDECLDADAFMEGYTGNYGWYYVVAWNKLYKKELFDQLRYPFGKRNEDEFIIHHIIYRCKKIACTKDGLYYYTQRSGSIMAQQFSVKNMDIGEALIDQYNFAKLNHHILLKNYAVERLSYKMEGWKIYAEQDNICKLKYDELRKNSRFLLYERSAWRSYGFVGRTYYRLELLFPCFAKTLWKLLHREV